MLTVSNAWIDEAEKQYPGIRKTIHYYETLDIPLCPKCLSTNTAQVSAGIIGRSMTIAAATTKIRLVPSNRKEPFFCRACEHFFNATARTEEAR